MIEYTPTIIEKPKVVDVQSAWVGIPSILKDIIVRFNLKTDSALEFGVDLGYSISALANYFTKVIGVDTFKQDIYDLNPDRASNYSRVKNTLKEYPNIQLVQSLFEEYIKKTTERFDLIHIDILHHYKPTYDCGEWAVQHSDCVIFHDTISHPTVKQACEDLAGKYNFEFYNYPKCFGLGILIKKV